MNSLENVKVPKIMVWLECHDGTEKTWIDPGYWLKEDHI
jgi:hypothetical protein